MLGYPREFAASVTPRRIASVIVGFLLLFSALSMMPVLTASAAPALPRQSGIASATPQAGGESQSRSSSDHGTFTPDYIILGQLKGSQLLQSQRPRSVPLLGSYQFAATYYTPQDFENAYGATSLFASGYSGKGETIAIIDAYGDPEIYQDLATFDQMFHLPAVNLSVIPVGPYEPSLGITYGWDGETALDVEAAHAMAPYAHINLVVAANASNALFYAVRLVATEHLGDAVSMSWGEPESLLAQSGFSELGILNYPYPDYYFSLGASSGISFFSSTGDEGAFDLTTSSYGGASFPATSPFVTAVGGTTLFLTPKSGYFASLNSTSEYQSEVAWSISPQYTGEQVSSGGGYSTIFPEPSYQQGAIGGGFRTVPDVAADANPYTGMIIVLEGGTYAIGGTSLSSPLWAGMTADLDQYTGRPLGSLNPYLYAVYGNKTAYGQAFHQITSGYNGGYQAGPGYNLVTGMGSPNLPGLAAAIKSQAQGLSITVSTSHSSIGVLPQYSYGDTFTISGTVTTQQGSTVSTGAFAANIESTQGLVSSVPLAFNGSAWVGRYEVTSADPPNTWTIEVTGSSGGVTGNGLTDIDVGESMLILSPVPYPFAPPIPTNQPFPIAVSASDPNGTAVSDATLTAHLVHGGKVIINAPLGALGGGLYSATPMLSASDPQGTYILVVNGSAFGSVYEYVYFGEGVTGVMITPVNEAVPSASPGQEVTFLAEPLTSQGIGAFTSNVTANVYSLQGTLISSVELQPAPNKVQFGVYNFFPFQQANFTIPVNLTQGFYRLEFLSRYGGNKTTGTQLGNFTTGFYVSGPTLRYTISNPAAVFEGQYVKVLAKVLNSSGAPVDTGVFFGTVIPSGLAYEATIGDFDGLTGIPMQYSPALGEWEGLYRIPSTLTSPSYQGNDLSYTAGPWTVFVSGESSSAQNVVPFNSYVNVLPYTFTSFGPLTPSTVQSAPLVTFNGTGYVLNDAATNSMTVGGLTISLGDDSIGNLTVTNSKVHVTGSQLGSLDAVNSTIVIADNTVVGSLSLTSTKVTLSDSSYQHLSPALPTISVTGLSQPINSSATFTVTVTGQQLVADSLVATIDGSGVPLTVTPSSTGIAATGTVDAVSLNDGVHSLAVTASQTDGFSASFSGFFSTNARATALGSQLHQANANITSLSGQLKTANANITSLSGQLKTANANIQTANASIGTLYDYSYVIAAIAVIGVVLALVKMRRK